MKTNKKKKNIKKLGKNNKKNVINKKNIIILSCVILIVIAIAIAIAIFGLKNKNLTCEKVNTNNSGIKQKNIINFTFKSGILNNINLKKEITINNTGEIDYTNVIKKSLEDTYKNLGVNSKIKKDNNTLIINVLYEKPKKYILDNIDILLVDGGLNINIISEDHENDYSSVDLSRKNTKIDIKKNFVKQGYVCK